jgi:hypothetical protein
MLIFLEEVKKKHVFFTLLRVAFYVIYMTLDVCEAGRATKER